MFEYIFHLRRNSVRFLILFNFYGDGKSINIQIKKPDGLGKARPQPNELPKHILIFEAPSPVVHILPIDAKEGRVGPGYMANYYIG